MNTPPAPRLMPNVLILLLLLPLAFALNSSGANITVARFMSSSGGSNDAVGAMFVGTETIVAPTDIGVGYDASICAHVGFYDILIASICHPANVTPPIPPVITTITTNPVIPGLNHTEHPFFL